MTSTLGSKMFFVSPNYTHEKLESPGYVDIVDVFEDRMRNWLLAPATQLLASANGAVAAVGLLMSYFEGIEIYRSGKDSKFKSKEFFGRGFKQVFGVDSNGEHVFDEVIDALYIQARCGFAHDGLFRNRVFFSAVRPQAFNRDNPLGIFGHRCQLHGLPRIGPQALKPRPSLTCHG